MMMRRWMIGLMLVIGAEGCARRHAAASAAGLSLADVTFHAMPLGGGFGRKLPGQIEIIDQAVKLAMQSPWPVKVIWPRSALSEAH